VRILAGALPIIADHIPSSINADYGSKARPWHIDRGEGRIEGLHVRLGADRQRKREKKT